MFTDSHRGFAVRVTLIHSVVEMFRSGPPASGVLLMAGTLMVAILTVPGLPVEGSAFGQFRCRGGECARVNR